MNVLHAFDKRNLWGVARFNPLTDVIGHCYAASRSPSSIKRLGYLEVDKAHVRLVVHLDSSHAL